MAEEEKHGMADAVAHLAALLVAPEQLEKVETLRENIKRKQISISAQLQAGVQRQMEEARLALQLLEKSEAFVGDIRGSFLSIEDLCRHCQGLLPQMLIAWQYPVMKELHKVRENLHNVMERGKQLVAIPEKVAEVREMLEDDRNLLLTHETIHELQELRTIALVETKEYPEEHSKLKRQFADLDGLAEQMETMLFRVTGEAINMSQSRPATLVKAFQVIEREERFDKKRRARNAEVEAQLAAGEITKADAAKQRELVGDYKKRCFAGFRSWVLQHFDFAFATLEADLQLPVIDGPADEDDEAAAIAEIMSGTVENVTERILNEAEDMFKELGAVNKHVCLCAPPKYNLFDFFVREYHKQFHLLIMRFANQRQILSAKDTLLLVNWVKNKYEPLLDEIDYAAIEPSLIEPLEELMANYRGHIRTLMDEWTPRIITADRAAPPDPIQGLYYTGAPVTLFKIVSQQLVIAKDTGYDQLMYEVVLECQSCLHGFQDCLRKMLTRNWEELEFEYILALINNNRKSTELLEKYSAKVFQLLTPRFADLVSFAQARDGFEELALLSQRVVGQAIYRDLESHMEHFGSKEWLKDPEPFMDAVCDTIFDYYLNHVEGFILDSVMANLQAAIVELLSKDVIAGFLDVTRKLPIDGKYIERFDEEMAILKKFSSKYMRDSKVEEAMGALRALEGLIKCRSTEEAKRHTQFLLQAKATSRIVNREKLEKFVGRRADFDRHVSRDLMQAFKEVFG